VAQRLQLAAEADVRCQAADAERRQEREQHAADLARLATVCGQAMPRDVRCDDVLLSNVNQIVRSAICPGSRSCGEQVAL